MKTYLKNIVSQLRSLSVRLDVNSMLINKPWAMITNELNTKKLIFKANNEVIISINGTANESRWELFPEAKCLLIDKLLYNLEFIDIGIMILKQDGSKDHYFILANENVVPDLNALSYLKQLRIQRLNLLEQELADGRVIEVAIFDQLYPQRNNPVTIDTEPLSDGKYQLTKSQIIYEIRNSRIYKILTEIKFKNSLDQEIICQQQDKLYLTYGDYIYVNGKQVHDDIIDFSTMKNAVISDGILVRLEYKNYILKWFSKNWKTFCGTYKN